MKLRRDDATLDPQVERELEALEAVLAGERVGAEHAELAELATELRGMRPTPDERFAADLDARAGAGFGAGPAAAGDRFAGAWERFRAAPLRRQVMPVGATALAAIVITTAVVASNRDEGGGSAQLLSGDTREAPAAGAGTAGSGARGFAPEAANAPSATTLQAEKQDATGTAPGTGPFASGERHRFKETSAELTLGTDAGRVQDVADDVFGVVGRYDGIVLSSSISDGAGGEAGANFELLIPSPRLGDALADLSQIAEVRSRRESSLDITAPVVTVGEHLRDAHAIVQGLLKQLAEAATDEERAAIEQQLRFQRQRVAGLRARLNSLHRRGNLSRLSLQVVTGDAASFPTTGGGEWTIGDAVHDAGRVLAVAAGVTLIGLAVLAPIALLILLAWLIGRSWIRASRERALG
jgi:hypothetical protein